MRYQVLDVGVHIWHDRNGNKWNYTTRKRYEIIGDVYNRPLQPTEHELCYQEQKMLLEPYKQRLGFFEKVVGYLECENQAQEKYSVRIICKDYFKLALVLATFLALVMAGGYGVYTLKPAPKQPVKELKAFEAPDGVENTERDKIVLPAYDNVVVEAKTNRLQTPLINTAGNQCQMAYELVLKKTGKVIFSSQNQRLKPGKAWYGFKLDRKVSKGQYPLVIKVTNYALNGKQKLNSSSLEATLIVE